MASSESTFMIEMEPSTLAKHPVWVSCPNYIGMARLYKGSKPSPDRTDIANIQLELQASSWWGRGSRY